MCRRPWLALLAPLLGGAIGWLGVALGFALATASGDGGGAVQGGLLILATVFLVWLGVRIADGSEWHAEAVAGERTGGVAIILLIVGLLLLLFVYLLSMQVRAPARASSPPQLHPGAQPLPPPSSTIPAPGDVP